MAKKAKAPLRTSSRSGRPNSAKQQTCPSEVERLGAWMATGVNPYGGDHPIKSLLNLLFDMRMYRLPHLHALTHREDGKAPTLEEHEAVCHEAMELEARPSDRDPHGGIRDGITELVRACRERCGLARLDPFRTNEVLKAAERALRTLCNFFLTLQMVRSIRSGLAKSPPKEIVDVVKAREGKLNWWLDKLAIGKFLDEHFDEPYENLLALWDNLKGQEAAITREFHSQLNPPEPKGKTVADTQTAKRKTAKPTVPSQHRDALARFLKWKQTCEGRPLIRRFWKAVMDKLAAYKFAHERSERDVEAFQRWYKNNWKG